MKVKVTKQITETMDLSDHEARQVVLKYLFALIGLAYSEDSSYSFNSEGDLMEYYEDDHGSHSYIREVCKIKANDVTSLDKAVMDVVRELGKLKRTVS